jgi:hypothetical protein
VTTLDELRKASLREQGKIPAERGPAAPEDEVAEEAPQPPPSPTTENITRNTVSQSAGKPVSQITGLPADQLTSLLSDQSAGKPVGKPISQSANLRDSALRVIAEASETPLVVITLKLPGGLNERLDDYIHENWKKRPKKQDLIKRAIQLLMYELETGEELLKRDGD